MNVTINGEKTELPGEVETVSGLLQHFRLNQQVIIVECNAEIIEKSKHAETYLASGDKIEVVHFVGGG